ncbi:DUF520 family protein [Pseudogulbenkiania ferrooxidans]|uniref:DUF520 family protein n=1 Tax=Pseudogulbenkiania ferrooxidans TaxID=549169 RepID=UPI0038B670AF
MYEVKPSMPSFDIVSEVNVVEVRNAVDQSTRVSTRTTSRAATPASNRRQGADPDEPLPSSVASRKAASGGDRPVTSAILSWAGTRIWAWNV